MARKPRTESSEGLYHVLNRGQPNSASFGDVSDQITAEVYWRMNVTKELAITPTLQFIKDPALNPDAGSMWVFGLRMRVAL